MRNKRYVFFLSVLSALTFAVTGCDSDSGTSRNKRTHKASDKEESEGKIEKSKIKKDGSGHAEKANFYVGTDFNNYFNGGHIAENDDYVFFESGDIYRYDKSDGKLMIVCDSGDGYLNVSEDGFLYFVKSEEIYRADIETGETELFLSAKEMPVKAADTIHDNTSMILADGKLYVAVSGYKKFAFFSVDTETKYISVYEQFESTEYKKNVSIDLKVIAAHGDELYYEYRNNSGPLIIKKIDLTCGAINEVNIDSLNNSYRETVYDVSLGGNTYDYYADLFNFSADDFVACYTHKYPYIYDFRSGKVSFSHEDAEYQFTEELSIYDISDKAFYNNSFYVLGSDHNVYSTDNKCKEPKVIYNCGDDDVYFGLADENLWIIPYGDSDIVKLSFDGTRELIPFSSAVDIADPNDEICKGIIRKSSGTREKPCMYTYPDTSRGIVRLLDPSTEVIILAKVVGVDVFGEKCIFYKIQDENNDTGYIIAQDIGVEREPDEFIDLYSETDISEDPEEMTADNSADDNDAPKTGIVITEDDDLNVRSGPSTNDEIIGKVKRGSRIEIISEKNSWYEIEINGKRGYVSSDYIDLD